MLASLIGLGITLSQPASTAITAFGIQSGLDAYFNQQATYIQAKVSNLPPPSVAAIAGTGAWIYRVSTTGQSLRVNEIATVNIGRVPSISLTWRL
jgi:hypothetical protein